MPLTSYIFLDRDGILPSLRTAKYIVLIMSRVKRTHTEAFGASDDFERKKHITRAAGRANEKLGDMAKPGYRITRAKGKKIDKLSPQEREAWARENADYVGPSGDGSKKKRTTRRNRRSATEPAAVSAAGAVPSGHGATHAVENGDQRATNAVEGQNHRQEPAHQDRPQADPHDDDFASNELTSHDQSHDELPLFVVDKDVRTGYSMRTRPDIVTVTDAGHQRAAMMMAPQTVEALKRALEGYQAAASVVHYMSTEQERLAELKERVIRQLQILDAEQRNPELSRSGVRDLEAVHRDKAFLYEALQQIAQQPAESEAKLKRHKMGQLKRCDKVMSELYKTFETANIVLSWDLEAWEDIPPFDVERLKGMEAGAHEGNMGDELGHDGAEDVDGRSGPPLDDTSQRVTPDNLVTKMQEMHTEWTNLRNMRGELQELQKRVDLQEGRVQAQQVILNTRVIEIEAGGFACETGEESAHVDQLCEQLLKRRRRAICLKEQPAECRDPYSVEELHQAQADYRELRDNLEKLGFDCGEAELEDDRAELLSSMEEAHTDWAKCRAFELYEIHEKEVKERAGVLSDDRRQWHDEQIAYLVDKGSADRSEYERLRKELQRLGLTVAYKDVPQEPWVRPLQREEREDTMEEFQARADRINGSVLTQGLRELQDGAGETQWDRWRCGLGPYADDALESELPQADAWEGCSVRPREDLDDDVSYRTDQTKLQQWEDMMARNRVQFDQDETGRPVGPPEMSGHV